MQQARSLELRDSASLMHPASNLDLVAREGPNIIAGGEGIHLTDRHGHRLIDGVAGLWCVNVGYGRRELAQAMSDAAMQLSYYHSFAGASNVPQIELAERLLTLVPDGLSKVFFGSGGSEGNDSLLKIVRYFNNVRGRPQKKKVISRWQAYHGTSLASASLTGLPSFHQDFDLPIDGVLHTGSPDFFRHGEPGESEAAFAARRVAELEALIEREGPETIAAFIAEPVLGAGGVVTPPQGYFEALQPLLKKHDILFIVDEVVCGYGRLGTWFGCDRYDLQPDMMTTAKALTSGYFPMSASFVSEAIWEVLREGSRRHGNFAHGYTYAGHPIGAAVAMANLDIIEGEQLVPRAAEVGAHFHRCLQDAFGAHPRVGEVRGTGMIAAVQLVREREGRQYFDAAEGMAKRVAAAAYRHGLITRPLPTVDSLAFSPPLSCSREDVEQIVARLAAAVDEVTASA
mgnify:CR=1 FL=1